MNAGFEQAEGYQVRPARPDEAAGLAEMRQAMMLEMNEDEHASHHSDPAIRERLEQFFAEKMASNALRFWMVEYQGHSVGMAGYFIMEYVPRSLTPGSGRRGYVTSVWVHPEHRRRGLARRMMDAIIAEAKTLGLDRLELRASDEGRPLYLQIGFKPVELFRLELQ